jgi:[amino group carrier protein]-lysine/ornithine hydrolase
LQSSQVSLLKRILEAYSPSGSESELSTLLLKELRANGVGADLDGAGNVVAEIGDQGPRILLCGHMDTIPGRIPVIEKDGFLHGRGAVDAKSSLAAMILGALSASKRALVPSQMTIAGVVEEETSSRGMESILSRGVSYDLAVFGEPSGTSNIIIGYKGSLHLEILCRTQGGHSSSPWLSPSSLEEAIEFWKSLRETILENESESKFDALTGTLVDVRNSPGGNSIPSTTTLQVDVRLPPRSDAQQITRKIEEFREDYQKTQKTQFDILFNNPTAPFLGSQDSEAVRAFRYAIRKTTGEDVHLVRKTGTSDMNLLAEKCKIPMIAYGPGDSSLDHTDLERIQIADYLKSIDVYSLAIERFLAMRREQLTVATA